METVVAPAAADAAATMLATAREDCQRVHKYLARLKEVLLLRCLSFCLLDGSFQLHEPLCSLAQ